MKIYLFAAAFCALTSLAIVAIVAWLLSIGAYEANVLWITMGLCHLVGIWVYASLARDALRFYKSRGRELAAKELL